MCLVRHGCRLSESALCDAYAHKLHVLRNNTHTHKRTYTHTHAGAVHSLPRFTSAKVRTMLDMPDMKAYSDLANAYGSDNPDKLLRVAEQHMTTYSNVSVLLGGAPCCVTINSGPCCTRGAGWWCCCRRTPGGRYSVHSLHKSKPAVSSGWHSMTSKSSTRTFVVCRAVSNLHLSPHIRLCMCLSLCLQDNNVGLVKQVLASRPMRTIQRLTQTYVTLSLAEIARAAGLKSADEAEAMILK